MGLTLGVSGIVFAIAAPAGAQNPVYPPSNHCGIQLSTSDVRADQTFTITGTQGAPNVPVTITIESTPVVIATTSTNAAGEFQVDATVPAGTEPGIHTIRANGPESCAAEVRVVTGSTPLTSPSRGGGSGLAFTGANPLALVLVALMALTVGYVLVAGERRHRTRRATIRRERRERRERIRVG